MNSEHEENLFDRLPDAVVNLIFNKVHDAKSLCRSMSVCTRFQSIIPQINTIFLTIPPLNPISINNSDSEVLSNHNSKPSCCGLQNNLLKSLINKVVIKPLQFLLQIVMSKSSASHSEVDGEGYSLHSANKVLKNFKEIQKLHIELPSDAGKIGSRNDTLLKWNAEFGSKLESCVILGATSLGETIEEESEQLDVFLNNEELKLRVVWIVSCLIAASARHYLLQQVVPAHGMMLQDVVITDGSKQGRLCMKKEQIEELRNFSIDLEASQSIERIRVPALKMKLWNVPVLELPASGCVLKGATLVVIRPVDGPNGEEISDGELAATAFGGEEEEKVFGEAVAKLIKKKTTCRLEMNSF